MDRGFFPAVLGTRQRVMAGVGVALGFGAPFLLSVALVASSGDPSLLILPLPCLGVLWVTQGLAPTGFALERNGVRFARRWLSRLVPYSTILRCDRQSRRIGGLGALGLNGLFGSHGWRWNPSTGWHYLAISNSRDLVSLYTKGGLVVISPSRPDEFVARLSTRIGSGGAAGGTADRPAPGSAGRGE